MLEMKSEEIKQLFEKFETAAIEFNGVECWSARELQHLLGYSKWENFEKVVAKAKEACNNAGEAISDHFPDVRKVIEAGKGAQHEIGDILLTRYASYLTAQNGDSRKTEKQLSGVLYERGIENKGFGMIRSKGDQALFNLSTPQFKRKLKVPDNRPVADFLPTISIKAKDLSAEMTSLNVQSNDLRGQIKVEREHVDNNKAVRKMLLERGIVPENLPPAEDVKKVERKLRSEEKKVLKGVKK